MVDRITTSRSTPYIPHIDLVRNKIETKIDNEIKYLTKIEW